VVKVTPISVDQDRAGDEALRADLDNPLLILTAAFPRFLFPPESVAIYMDKLSRVPGPELRLVLHEWIVREKHFPTIAEILALWRANREPQNLLPQYSGPETTEQDSKMRHENIEQGRIYLQNLRKLKKSTAMNG